MAKQRRAGPLPPDDGDKLLARARSIGFAPLDKYKSYNEARAQGSYTTFRFPPGAVRNRMHREMGVDQNSSAADPLFGDPAKGDFTLKPTSPALTVGFELIDHSDPSTAAMAAGDKSVDVAVVDLQVASMGGMAITRSIRDLEEPIPVVLLLDREADRFLAGRSGASAWVVKPFTSSALRSAVIDASGDA